MHQITKMFFHVVWFHILRFFFRTNHQVEAAKKLQFPVIGGKSEAYWVSGPVLGGLGLLPSLVFGAPNITHIAFDILVGCVVRKWKIWGSYCVFAIRHSLVNFLLFWCEFIRKTSYRFGLPHDRSFSKEKPKCKKQQ